MLDTLTKLVLFAIISENGYKSQRTFGYYFDWNISLYIFFSLSFLDTNSWSHCLINLTTSLFWPLDISWTFKKLSFAFSKSFSFTHPWPCLYQAFSLFLSNSITTYLLLRLVKQFSWIETTSASSLILSALASFCCSRHAHKLLYTK